jgi:hypothetical protein
MLDEDYDVELFEAIKRLVDKRVLSKDTFAHAISQRVVYEGYESLTRDQRLLFDEIVAPALARQRAELETVSDVAKGPKVYPSAYAISLRTSLGPINSASTAASCSSVNGLCSSGTCAWWGSVTVS